MSFDKFACGRELGSGLSRTAYVSKHWPDRVVKITGGNDNLTEARIWRGANRYLRRYLARVYAVSEDGTRMLMQRTRAVSRRALRRHLVPVCINHDAHSGNFGRLPDGRIVMHDYAEVCDSPTKAGKWRSTPEHV